MSMIPIRFLLFLFMLLVVVFFASQNTETVTVHFFKSVQMPLIVVIFISMIIGCLLTIPFYLRQYYRYKRKVKDRIKKMKEDDGAKSKEKTA
jgi:uncharacterized integral membrane protein